MDPFELTIAQWCYVYGMHRGVDGVAPMKDELVEDVNGKNPGEPGYIRTTKRVFDEDAMMENARRNIVDASHAGSMGLADFKEMEYTYWVYLSIWETAMWNELKEKYRNTPRSYMDDDIVEVDESNTRASAGNVPVDDDKQFIQWLVTNQIYDPLKDMRPYYHATYDKVRGTGQVYKPVQYGPNFVIDRNKGDEYQTTSHVGAAFMDILNSKVVYKTKLRSVTIDEEDGGEKIVFDDDEDWYSG